MHKQHSGRLSSYDSDSGLALLSSATTHRIDAVAANQVRRGTLPVDRGRARHAKRSRGIADARETTPILADAAYAKLLDAIRSGTLRPGTRVREIQIADWLRMSRTPVRQAIQRLESEGLLMLAPRTGLVVTNVDESLVTEMYLIREILEGTAARLAAEFASPADLSRLQSIVHLEIEGISDPEKAAESNRKFHSIVFGAAKNRFLVKSLRALHDSMALLGKTTLTSRQRRRQAALEHSRIVDAIMARNAVKAEQLMRDHIRSAYKERLELLFG